MKIFYVSLKSISLQTMLSLNALASLTFFHVVLTQVILHSSKACSSGNMKHTTRTIYVSSSSMLSQLMYQFSIVLMTIMRYFPFLCLLVSICGVSLAVIIYKLTNRYCRFPDDISRMTLNYSISL